MTRELSAEESAVLDTADIVHTMLPHAEPLDHYAHAQAALAKGLNRPALIDAAAHIICALEAMDG